MILITGATGYIGKDLVRRFEPDEIKLLTRKKVNLPFEIVKGSVENKKSVKSAMKNVDYVIHLAAGGNHFASFSELFEVNVKGTQNVIEAAAESNVNRIVHMSSMAVAMPVKTSYGETKKLAEDIVKKHWNDLDISILRAPLVYDLDRLKRLRRIFMLPMTTKNFKVHLVYKKSLVDAIVNSLKFGKSEIYNIADKNPINFHDFHRAVLNTNLKPLYLPHFLIGFPITFSYLVKHSFNLLGLNPPITPEFLRHLFQDREFDIKKSAEYLRYKPVDTLNTVKELYRNKTSK